MSTFYLINAIRFGTFSLLPGTLVDDSVTDTAPIIAAGGVLVSSSNAAVAAAALIAQAAHKNRGSNEAEMAGIMNAAMDGATDAVDAATLRSQEGFPGGSLPAKGVAVHAQVAAGAPLNVTTAFTLPFPRRSLQVVLGAGGANPVTLTANVAYADGTTEALTAVCAGAGTYVFGGANSAKCPESITSLTSTIDPGGTVDLQTSDAFAVGKAYSGTPVLAVDGVANAVVTAHGASGGIMPTTIPNGTRSYVARYDSTHVHTLS